MAERIEAIDIKKASIIALSDGGSKDVFPGAVLIVGKGKDVTEDDARFLIAGNRAEACGSGLKAERARAAKQAAGDKKDGDKK